MSSALGLQACSPASHHTSPCPAPDLTPGEVTAGCHLTCAQNSTAAGSGIIQWSSFFPVQLMIALCRQQGRVFYACKAGAKPSLLVSPCSHAAHRALSALRPCCDAVHLHTPLLATATRPALKQNLFQTLLSVSSK